MVTKSITIERQYKKSRAMPIGWEEVAQPLLRNAGLGIYIVQEGEFQYVNPLFQDLTGHAEEELLGAYPLDLVHPHDREAVRKKAIENLKGQAVYPYEYRLIKKNGDLMWVLENLASAEYKGKPAAGSFMDTTERKMAEKALKENEQKLRSLVEATSDWVWELDQNIIYTYISPKVKDLLGYEPEEGARKNGRQG